MVILGDWTRSWNLTGKTNNDRLGQIHKTHLRIKPFQSLLRNWSFKIVITLCKSIEFKVYWQKGYIMLLRSRLCQILISCSWTEELLYSFSWHLTITYSGSVWSVLSRWFQCFNWWLVVTDFKWILFIFKWDIELGYSCAGLSSSSIFLRSFDEHLPTLIVLIKSPTAFVNLGISGASLLTFLALQVAILIFLTSQVDPPRLARPLSFSSNPRCPPSSDWDGVGSFHLPDEKAQVLQAEKSTWKKSFLWKALLLEILETSTWNHGKSFQQNEVVMIWLFPFYLRIAQPKTLTKV